MQYFADDIKLPPCVKCLLTCFFSCPVRSLKNTFVIVSDLGKPRRHKIFHLFGHWSTFVLVMMKLMIMLMKITMIECVEKLDEKGPIILGPKTLPQSVPLSPLAVGARLSRSRRIRSFPIGRRLDQSRARISSWRRVGLKAQRLGLVDHRINR